MAITKKGAVAPKAATAAPQVKNLSLASLVQQAVENKQLTFSLKDCNIESFENGNNKVSGVLSNGKEFHFFTHAWTDGVLTSILDQIVEDLGDGTCRLMPGLRPGRNGGIYLNR